MRNPLVLILVLASAAACRPERRPELPLERTLSLTPAAARARTLAFDSAGPLLGVPGALLRVDSTASRVTERVPLPDSAAPRLIGRLGSAYLVLQGEQLLRAGPDSTRPPLEAVPWGSAVVALDPKHRFVLGGAGSGAVLGFETDSLAERWSWPRLGRAATALAIAPEADQVYLALARSEAEASEPEIVARDAETGRMLHRGELPWPGREVVAAGQGRLYVLAARGSRGAVLALAVGPAGIRERWRRPLGRLGLSTEARLALSPEGARLVVFTSGPDGGITVLDAGNGEPVARGREGPLDVAFDARGALWLLRPGELARVEGSASRAPR